MVLDINDKKLNEYVVNKFKSEGDFDFLNPGEIEKMVEAMAELDAKYMLDAKIIEEDRDYDDDDAYEAIFEAMKERFPEYKAYCMRLCEDYLDFTEEYLASIDAIEWE